MNINEKQRLWSKYYLVYFGKKNSFISLARFINKEVEQMNLTKTAAKQKKTKLLKYMLKTLTKDEILKTYCPFNHRISNGSKNEIIDKIAAYM